MYGNRDGGSVIRGWRFKGEKTMRKGDGEFGGDALSPPPSPSSSTSSIFVWPHLELSSSHATLSAKLPTPTYA